ncbi:PP2C family protein-serine/threonine phosphatase [Orenia marismortui]|uniref:PP2C family protein-serine/threonine phosphatase n=1 Tax=Orenia marismortui TaxID=46469 RepID=UPI000378FCD5|nr:protein phosphatase 2C domain-containing protein [Orenia marismortui]
MRKENSKILTNFVTESGNFKKNRDYFAYVELDDMVCWVLADGLDSAQDILSAEIVAGSILNEFTEKPSMKRRAVKRYIKHANQALINESRIIKLHSTVLVVVSDYTSFVVGSVGNTRLYHFRKGKILTKTKDQSVAQMMLEVDKIREKELNQHKERNNLTNYLGQKGKIKINVSKKQQLKDDDTLLMCTSGFWENARDNEILDVIKEASDVEEITENLEDSILSKANNTLDNYTMVSLAIKKAFKEKVGKKRSYKKIAAILIPILILTGGFFTYKKIKNVKAMKTARIKKEKMKLKRLAGAIKNEKEGNKLYQEKQYEEALKKYQQVKLTYAQVKSERKLEAIKQKIDTIKMIITGQNLEEEGDEKFNSQEYKKALSKYNKAQLTYLKIKDYSLEEIESKISKSEIILKGVRYEEEADVFFKSDKFMLAKEKYTIALQIYTKNNLSQKEKAVEERIIEAEKMIQQGDKLKRARAIELEGDNLFQAEDFKQSNLKYLEAKVIYSGLNMTEKINKINNKINKVSITKLSKEAREYEELGDMCMQSEEKNYDEAIFNYRQAKKIYSKINMTKRIEKTDYKINNAIIVQKYTKAEEYEAIADKNFKEEEYEEAISNYEQANNIYSEINKDKDCQRIEDKIKETKEKKKKFLFFF